MKKLLLEYKHVKELDPLINRIEQESVSLASFEKKEETPKVIDLPAKKITEVKKEVKKAPVKPVRDMGNYTDKNLKPVPDFSTPISR